MRRRHAFTLVELLVVIGIIALLISILLPSLNRARQQARLVQCMSNLRQFGIGLRLYADSNRGLSLDMKLASDGSNGYPQDLTTISGGGTYTPTTKMWHVGRLWQLKILTTPRVAYCPANYDAPSFGWNSIASSWPNGDAAGDPIRSDYVYMPQWRQLAGSPSRTYYTKFASIPNQRILAADIFRSQSYTSHKLPGNKAEWNLLFPDGHAVTIVSADVWQQMKVQGEYKNNGNPGWDVLENYRDMLETLAAGRNIMDNPMGYGGNTPATCRVYHVAGETGCGIGTLEGRKASYP